MPVFISSDKFSFDLDTLASVYFLSFDNAYPPASVPAGSFVCLLSLYESADFECSVGISSDYGGEVVLRIARLTEGGYGVTFIRTDRYLGKGTSVIGLNFHRNIATMFLDGLPVIEIPFEYCKFSRIYIGSCEISLDGDIFVDVDQGQEVAGKIHKFLALPRVMTYPEFMRKTLEFSGQAATRIISALEPFILRADGFSDIQTAIDKLHELETFEKFILELPWALGRVLADFPPGSDFIESDIRDKVHDLLQTPYSLHKREEYEKKNFTDLAIHYQRTGDGKASSLVTDTYRIEFKIWGRRDYKELPAQPLRYMSERESVGAVVLVDTRKKHQMEDFRAIVRSQSDFPCALLSDASQLQTNLPHFLSLHKDGRFTNTRLIINFYLHIPE